MMDIDDFKQINDAYGHFFGDTCLKHIAQVFEKNTREGDWVSRWGGDEFVGAFWREDDDHVDIEHRMKAALERSPIKAPDGRPITLLLSSAFHEVDSTVNLQELLQLIDPKLTEPRLQKYSATN